MLYTLDGVGLETESDTWWVAPIAVVIGRVRLEPEAAVWWGAVLRGDNEPITVGRGSNVQDNVTVHVPEAGLTDIGEDVTIGHGAVLEGCVVEQGALIGMNAVLMDDVELGEGCIVGALSFLRAASVWPARKVIAGNPAKVIKEVSDEMLAWKTEGTKLYQRLPSELHATLTPCEPLREVPTDRPPITTRYSTWKERSSE